MADAACVGAVGSEDFPADAFALPEPAEADLDLVPFLLVFFFAIWSSGAEADLVCDALRVDVIIVIVSHLS